MNDQGARVFISCGQARDSDELQVAYEIERRLRDLGFDPYVALQEQTLRGVKENIFGRLAKSEYFLFIDFKREALPDGAGCRGSLFSHQELGVASFLDLSVLAFQEEGVRRSDGLLGFIQGNSVPFSDRANLPDIVESRVRRSAWDSAWRFELVLERDPSESVTAWVSKEQQGTFYHVAVRNRHRADVARNCCVYLRKIRDIDSGQIVEPLTVEFKWAGYILPNAHIHPGSDRLFDAFWVPLDNSREVRFTPFSDSNFYTPIIKRPGRFELTYEVVSDNFPTVRRNFTLEMGPKVEETRLEAVST